LYHSPDSNQADKQSSQYNRAGVRRTAILCIAGQIDRDINLTIVEELGDFLIAVSANIVKLIKCRADPLSHLAAVITTEGNADNFKSRTIVLLKQLSRLKRCWM
jgi:hypothetical protein